MFQRHADFFGTLRSFGWLSAVAVAALGAALLLGARRPEQVPRLAARGTLSP